MSDFQLGSNGFLFVPPLLLRAREVRVAVVSTDTHMNISDTEASKRGLIRSTSDTRFLVENFLAATSFSLKSLGLFISAWNSASLGEESCGILLFYEHRSSVCMANSMVQTCRFLSAVH